MFVRRNRMRLPQPARILLPHQPPMVCIDRLLEAGEDRGLCEIDVGL